jgi:cell division protein FtsA
VRPAARVDSPQNPGLLVLDLGASKALALVAVADGDRARITGWAERAAVLTSHGALVDPHAARGVLADVLEAAQARAGRRLTRVVAGVGGGQVRCIRARGSARTKLAVPLQAAHVDRALDAAADIGLPSDHEVLHVLPSAFLVDGVRIARTPVGTRGRNLTAEAAVVTVRSHVLDQLQRVLEGLGYELVGAAAEPLAAARAVLSAEDRTRGCVLVDIGAETTGLAVYRDGVIHALAWVQAGGVHVTRDIGFALQLELEQAETLKRRAGHALVEAVDPSRQVEVLRGRERLSVNQQTLAGIIEARMEEMLSMGRDALRAQQALGLGDRIVLAGGGARLRGAVELAEQVFEAPVRLAAPDGGAGWREAAGDPACCTALGLVEYALRAGLLRSTPAAPWTRAWDGLRRAVGDRRGRGRMGRTPGDRSDAAASLAS